MSTPPLFLIDSLPGADRFILLGEEGHHAARVKRVGVGESVRVGDGAGTVLECRVASVVPDGLELDVLERRALPLCTPRLVAVQALPKGDRAELAVEIMTELGVDEIVPWAATRSITRWSGARGTKALGKWRRTAAEASKQSRRARVPVVADLATTEHLARRLADAHGLVLHESAVESLASVALPDPGTGVDVVIVIGPEGGIEEGELQRFTAAGAVAVRMGEPVLRTSTAGAAALAALSLRLARWA